MSLLLKTIYTVKNQKCSLNGACNIKVEELIKRKQEKLRQQMRPQSTKTKRVSQITKIEILHHARESIGNNKSLKEKYAKKSHSVLISFSVSQNNACTFEKWLKGKKKAIVIHW